MEKTRIPFQTAKAWKWFELKGMQKHYFQPYFWVHKTRHTRSIFQNQLTTMYQYRYFLHHIKTRMYSDFWLPRKCTLVFWFFPLRKKEQTRVHFSRQWKIAIPFAFAMMEKIPILIHCCRPILKIWPCMVYYINPKIGLKILCLHPLINQ